ncbi:MAG: acetyl-CoA carboxylase biotin carboxyl carrier protein [Bacteroidetes bacterium]|nr:acetyl-CoA carboxylase biotin carboxyl carrier protein [Bacteroidota bacterium]MBL0017108.1 acetyl-CoA carboxylase biotin carboxyl carrier protein [Bacteroidota bacterium]MBP6638749.1 acetyl-CoA carboxylase biotin carboxyl carrier protein [Bacteroidia bacterium]MBP6722398.1 acetyl-CoA carboxylase biotin carboxyl carrier protein [Bacteroidia bacterium]MBP8073902.1 acetyl-CoA carboxylase biotin carboxyl carrier protein [Bacteroidia bacterium]
MDIKDIQELLKFINRSTLTDVEIEQKDFRLRIQRKPEGIVYAQMPQTQQFVQQQMPQLVQQSAPATTDAPAPVAESKPATDSGKNLREFRAPFIGTFYRSNGPDKEPFVKVGDSITSGKVLGIIEAMKLFNEIESDINGTIVKILVENAQPVEYDQPLFLIEIH